MGAAPDTNENWAMLAATPRTVVNVDNSLISMVTKSPTTGVPVASHDVIVPRYGVLTGPWTATRSAETFEYCGGRANCSVTVPVADAVPTATSSWSVGAAMVRSCVATGVPESVAVISAWPRDGSA